MSDTGPSDPQVVVLMHGLGRSAASMHMLKRRLTRRGHRCVSINYPSRRHSLAALVEIVGDKISKAGEGATRIDLVGHSLGGVLALQVKRTRRDLPIRRVVQIGSPNRGSGMAATLRELRFARSIWGPVLADLADMPGETEAEPDDDVISIAGTGFPAEIANRYGVSGPNDGLVSLRSAWSAQAGQRHLVRSLHGWMPYSREVARLVERALR